MGRSHRRFRQPREQPSDLTAFSNRPTSRLSLWTTGINQGAALQPWLFIRKGATPEIASSACFIRVDSPQQCHRSGLEECLFIL